MTCIARMTRMKNGLIRSIVFILGLFSLSWAWDREEIGNIQGLYEGFKEAGKEAISPVHGFLILKSGVLANVRFHGWYGPKNDQFLCHYAITNPPSLHAPETDTDCPQDNTTAIVQQLFPSPGRELRELRIPAPKKDFFKNLPLKQLANFINLYEKYKKKLLESTGETLEFSETKLYEDALDEFKDAFTEWSEASTYLKATRGNWKEHNKPDNLVNSYAKMFAGSLSPAETKGYPNNFVTSVLLAFAWKKAESLNDMREFAQYLIGHQLSFNDDPNRFSHKGYEQWKQDSLTEKNQVATEQWNSLVQDPERLIFNTLAYDLYDNLYPKMLGTGNATHTYKGKEGTDEKEGFSDCGETSLRNFFNIILSDPKKRTFQTDYLKAFPGISKKFLAFYNGNEGQMKGQMEGDPGVPKEEPYKQNSYDKISGTEIDRSAWANVVSSLNQENQENQETDPLSIKYRNQKRCNIDSGLDNMLTVIAKILNDKDFTNILIEYNKETPNDKNRATLVTKLFKKLSRKYFELSWKSEGQSQVLTDTGKEPLVIFINGVPRFNWEFRPGHFALTPINEKGIELDWRRNQEDLLTKIQSNPISYPLRSSLFPFYFDPSSTNESNKEQGNSFVPEGFYGSDLSGKEQMLRALNYVLSSDRKAWMNFAFFQFPKIRGDAAMNEKIFEIVINNNLCQEVPKEILSREGRDDLIIGGGKTTILSFALRQWSLDSVRILLNRPDFPWAHLLLTPDSEGTFLHVASHYGDADIVKLLLKNKIGKTKRFSLRRIKNREGDTPLHVAIKSGNRNGVSIVKALLDDPDVREACLSDKDIKDREGDTPLHLAVERGDSVMVEALLDDPGVREACLSDKNIKNLKGDTPLHVASRYGNAEIIEMLLKDEALRNLFLSLGNIKNPKGNTPLHVASRYGNAEIIEMLLKDEALRNLFLSPGNIKNLEGDTPLHVASRYGKINTVKLLLDTPEAKKQLISRENIKNREGDTPLRVAIKGGDRNGVSIVKALLADPDVREVCLSDENIKDREGYTPLYRAIERGDSVMVEALLADPEVREACLSDENFKDRRGDTPLHWASLNVQREVVNALLADSEVRGACLSDKNIKNREGDTPLHVASRYGRINTIKLLLDTPEARKQLISGENIKNLEGDTPLHLAIKGGNSNMVEALLADPEVREACLSWKNKDGKTPLELAEDNPYIKEIIEKALKSLPQGPQQTRENDPNQPSQPNQPSTLEEG
jgi:ankyrin repeat protein